ncbi:MAG: hypothetical protein HKN48_11455 [Flavobacteriaceae bacterium]|nr:hypothetical protein [Flavobacteriaceae bacterium]
MKELDNKSLAFLYIVGMYTIISLSMTNQGSIINDSQSKNIVGQITLVEDCKEYDHIDISSIYIFE